MTHFHFESFETASRGRHIRPALGKVVKMILRPAAWLAREAAEYRTSCQLSMLTDVQLEDIGVDRQVLYVEWRFTERAMMPSARAVMRHEKTDAADADFT